MEGLLGLVCPAGGDLHVGRDHRQFGIDHWSAIAIWGLWITIRARTSRSARAEIEAGQGNVPAAMRICIGIVHRRDPEKGTLILMVRRRDGAENLTWQFPSGQVKPKELPAARVVEEVREETGVECRVEAEISQRIHPDTHTHCFYYICAWVSGRARNADRSENDGVEWVPSFQVADLVTTNLDPNVEQWLTNTSGTRQVEAS